MLAIICVLLMAVLEDISEIMVVLRELVPYFLQSAPKTAVTRIMETRLPIVQPEFVTRHQDVLAKEWIVLLVSIVTQLLATVLTTQTATMIAALAVKGVWLALAWIMTLPVLVIAAQAMR